MRISLKELRQLIREATEEDVLRGLADFDAQASAVAPDGKLVFHTDGFDVEVQKMPDYSKTKPFIVTINGKMKTWEPSMADAVSTARSYYEKHLRRTLKVRKDYAQELRASRKALLLRRYIDS